MMRVSMVRMMGRLAAPAGLRASLLPAGMLAVAMGVVLAFGSLYETVVLRPLAGLPRLVSIGMDAVDEDGQRFAEGLDPSPQELKDIPQWPWLVGKPVQQDVRTYRVEAGGATRSLLVSYASSNYFTTLGIRPILGRTFTEEDPEAGALLSWSAWQNAQGRLSIGAPITVDGVSLPIIGVLPRGVQGLYPGFEPEVWVSLESRARSGEREARFFKDRSIGHPTFGILRPGVSIAQAQTAFETLMPAWKAQRSTHPRELHAAIRSARWMGERAWGQFLPGSPLLWLASSLLVLMAAINVGNLQVAKWMKERQAWSIRAALGASPLRLARDLSGTMMGALALGALGAMPVAWVIQCLIARFPPPSEFPMVFRPEWHWSGFLWVLGLVLALALPLMAMAWIWFLRHTLRVDARQSLGGLRWRQALLGAQIALSAALLCGTLTSLRALRRAQSTPLGMDVRGIYAFSFAMPLHLVGGRTAMVAEWTRLSDHFRAVPGWETSCVCIPPCECFGYPQVRYRLPSGAQFSLQENRNHPGSFALLRIPFLLGRDFSESDTPESPAVAIVTASTARTLWPGQNPLGQTLEDSQDRRYQIIGVVADHLWGGLAGAPHPLAIFLCNRQRVTPLQTLLIRSSLTEAGLRDRVEREVALLDPRLSIERAEPLPARVDRMMQPQRLAATLFSLMGTAALLLCLTGLYALQRYLTVQRMQEIGLRMALGATPRRVRLDFLRSLRWPLGLGLALGGLLTGLAWHLLRTRIADIPPLPIANLAWTLAALLAVALGAAWLPLRRLERTEPAELLRDSDPDRQAG